MLSQKFKEMSDFGSDHNEEYFVLFFFELESVFQEMSLFKRNIKLWRQFFSELEPFMQFNTFKLYIF